MKFITFLIFFRLVQASPVLSMVTTSDNATICVASYKALSKERASVLILPGPGEPLELFADIAEQGAFPASTRIVMLANSMGGHLVVRYVADFGVCAL